MRVTICNKCGQGINETTVKSMKNLAQTGDGSETDELGALTHKMSDGKYLLSIQLEGNVDICESCFEVLGMKMLQLHEHRRAEAKKRVDEDIPF